MKKKQLSAWGKQCKANMILLDKPLPKLSQEVDLGATYVSAIINERSIPGPETIVKISTALNVSPTLYPFPS